MVVSFSKLSRGKGLRYLLETVVRGDGAVDLSSPLTRYYTESGTPPGRFMGAGLGALDEGRGIAPGTEVSEWNLRNMLEVIGDPITGELLNRRSRCGRASTAGSDKVAGFDLTFSPSKSISTAWAVADAGTQAVIYQSHLDAIDLTIKYAEEHVFFSRSGSAGVVQEEIEGVIAAAFDHWDSRAGDPQLHTHVIIENLARTVSDGQWRTIDSRGLHQWTVSLSEMHKGILTDLLSERLGWSFDNRQQVHSNNPHFEITGVSDELQKEFSQRSEAINPAKDAQVEAFTAKYGRPPTSREVLKFRQHATLTTRPDKHHHTLAEQTEQWRNRARAHVGADTVGWVQSLSDITAQGLRLRADDFTPEQMGPVVEASLVNVTAKRPTFNRANVLAEVHRQMQGWTFASPADRIAAGERVADHALAAAQGHVVALTPAERQHVPSRFRRPDGSSKFAPATAQLFTTGRVLEAESRLLELGRQSAAPVASLAAVVAVAETDLPGKDHGMSLDQAYAVEQIATSGRVLDVLVGPAGTGKSTSMAGLRAVWELEHGPGSVVGLAPSAAAAEVLGEELGIATENTAKWIHEYKQAPERARTVAGIRAKAATARTAIKRAELLATATKIEDQATRFRPQAGQLVIVDEASLAGTLTLDEITQAAASAGAKVLLVGDWAQLSAVDAGGAFSMLVNDRGMVPELNEVRRFTNAWEKAASTRIRIGDDSIIDTYVRHGRVLEGGRETMLDALYTNWLTDVRDGKRSLMVAGDLTTVTALNQRAQADRIAAGEVASAEHGTAALHDGTTAHVGDRVVTRQNKRELATGRGWVKNGDEWSVTAINTDGSLTVRRASKTNHDHGKGGAVVLPADYVATKLELGYASTAHRAQGSTVDTAHAMVTATTTREV
ncbi:MobF family relaxase, partial [Nocardioides hankookensis]